MAKRGRKPKNKEEVTTKVLKNLCPSCDKKGVKVTMTPRYDGTEICSKCQMWREVKNKKPETKEQKRARLMKELEELDSE